MMTRNPDSFFGKLLARIRGTYLSARECEFLTKIQPNASEAKTLPAHPPEESKRSSSSLLNAPENSELSEQDALFYTLLFGEEDLFQKLLRKASTQNEWEFFSFSYMPWWLWPLFQPFFPDYAQALKEKNSRRTLAKKVFREGGCVMLQTHYVASTLQTLDTIYSDEQTNLLAVQNQLDNLRFQLSRLETETHDLEIACEKFLYHLTQNNLLESFHKKFRSALSSAHLARFYAQKDIPETFSLLHHVDKTASVTHAFVSPEDASYNPTALEEDMRAWAQEAIRVIRFNRIRDYLSPGEDTHNPDPEAFFQSDSFWKTSCAQEQLEETWFDQFFMRFKKSMVRTQLPLCLPSWEALKTTWMRVQESLTDKDYCFPLTPIERLNFHITQTQRRGNTSEESDLFPQKYRNDFLSFYYELRFLNLDPSNAMAQTLVCRTRQNVLNVRDFLSHRLSGKHYDTTHINTLVERHIEVLLLIQRAYQVPDAFGKYGNVFDTLLKALEDCRGLALIEDETPLLLARALEPDQSPRPGDENNPNARAEQDDMTRHHMQAQRTLDNLRDLQEQNSNVLLPTKLNDIQIVVQRLQNKLPELASARHSRTPSVSSIEDALLAGGTHSEVSEISPSTRSEDSPKPASADDADKRKTPPLSDFFAQNPLGPGQDDPRQLGGEYRPPPVRKLR